MSYKEGQKEISKMFFELPPEKMYRFLSLNGGGVRYTISQINTGTIYIYSFNKHFLSAYCVQALCDRRYAVVNKKNPVPVPPSISLIRVTDNK